VKTNQTLEIDTDDSMAYYDDDHDHKGYSVMLYVMREVHPDQLLLLSLKSKNFSDLPNIKVDSEDSIEP
jgi:hypothetical protein